jgi:TRAP-type C4-dicarboxylate transport system permease small subunit
LAAALPLGRAPVDTVLGLVDRLAALCITGCVGGMLLVVAAQVFARYVLNSSIGWADEVSRLLFVWAIFLAIPIGIRRGAHIGIELLTARLPGPLQATLGRIMALVAAGIMLLVAGEALVLVIGQWDELMVSIDLSAGWFLVALVAGCGHSALHLLRIALFGADQPEAAP